VDHRVAELTDALSRGRLTLAELSLTPTEELEAAFALAADYLETRRDREAVTIFAGLVALHPYDAKYWRAYGVALHRLLELHRARAAYDAALLLDPQTASIRCYRGEVLFYLGDVDAAREDLRAAAAGPNELVAKRGRDLLALIDQVAVEPVPHPPPSQVAAGEPAFQLRDGRPLPLEDSIFDDEPTAPMVERRAVGLAEETTRTAARFPLRLRPQSQPAAKEITATAVLPARRNATGAPTSPLPRESTDTAVVPGRRRSEPTTTAIIPRWLHPEGTRTAVIRRRAGGPLLDDDEGEG